MSSIETPDPTEAPEGNVVRFEIEKDQIIKGEVIEGAEVPLDFDQYVDETTAFYKENNLDSLAEAIPTAEEAKELFLGLPEEEQRRFVEMIEDGYSNVLIMPADSNQYLNEIVEKTTAGFPDKGNETDKSPIYFYDHQKNEKVPLEEIPERLEREIQTSRPEGPYLLLTKENPRATFLPTDKQPEDTLGQDSKLSSSTLEEYLIIRPDMEKVEDAFIFLDNHFGDPDLSRLVIFEDEKGVIRVYDMETKGRSYKKTLTTLSVGVVPLEQ